MKALHRPDLYGWSAFNEERNIDFHSVLWVRQDGNIAIDPLPLSEHDRAHLRALGGVGLIVITNSDHVRGASALAADTGARLAGPAAERDGFPLACHAWLSDGDEPGPGARVFELDGSKTAGELALVIEHTTLVVGDLIRSHRAGQLCLLPAQKLRSESAARASIQRLLTEEPAIDAVLTGDGWPVFRDARRVLSEI
jgi:hypothetical protein